MSRRLIMLKKFREQEEILDRLYSSLQEVDKKVFVSAEFSEYVDEMLVILASEIEKLQDSIRKIEREIVQEMKNANSN